MAKYVWCEDSKSGYRFWKVLFGTLYPEITVETQKSNSNLSKAVGKITDDGNNYYIILDNAVDNPDVLREFNRLKRNSAGKNNVRMVKLHSFEFSLLSFEYLEQWVFAEEDDLKDKRRDLLEARNRFVQIINNGGNATDLSGFKAVYHLQDKLNTETISAKLLFEITRNTGFETDKSWIGQCFINSCCEWNDRQEDDICGLDDKRLTVSEKMKQITEHSVLQAAFKEAGL